MTRSSLSSLGLVALVTLGACSSSPSNAGTPNGNGVNDVRAACQIRATWKNEATSACSACVAGAGVPRCPCADVDYAGKCAAQQTSMVSEPTCDGVSSCVNACAPTDCACVDACYAGKDACRTKASATDGCLAEVCDSYCR